MSKSVFEDLHLSKALLSYGGKGITNRCARLFWGECAEGDCSLLALFVRAVSDQDGIVQVEYTRSLEQIIHVLPGHLRSPDQSDDKTKQP